MKHAASRALYATGRKSVGPAAARNARTSSLAPFAPCWPMRLSGARPRRRPPHPASLERACAPCSAAKSGASRSSIFGTCPIDPPWKVCCRSCPDEWYGHSGRRHRSERTRRAGELELLLLPLSFAGRFCTRYRRAGTARKFDRGLGRDHRAGHDRWAAPCRRSARKTADATLHPAARPAWTWSGGDGG